MSDTVIDFYETEIPPFAAAELERLYQNVYTTLLRYTIYHDIAGASTYVKRSGGQVRALFLFHRHGRTLRVLNQQISVSAADVGELSAALFARYPGTLKVTFYALDVRLDTLALPYRQYWCLQDIVLRPPATLPLYMDALGQKMRYNLRNYERRLLRDFPSFTFANLDTTNAGEPAIRAILALAAARVAAKDKHPYVTEAETGRIVALVAAYGMVGVARIDGQICGGQICYRVGDNFFMHIVAHDPRYDAYTMGTLIVLYTIAECIARGAAECRLMGGGHAHKGRFLAAPLEFTNVLVYRSRLRCWLDLGQAGAAALRYRHRVVAALHVRRPGGRRPLVLRLAAAPRRAWTAIGAVLRAVADRWRRRASAWPRRH